MWRVEKLMSNEHLNKYEEDFVSLVCKDIDGFLSDKTGHCVLIFPSLDNRRRYLIHKVAKLLSVNTFSVGEGTRRTTVVYNFKNFERQDITGDIDLNDTHLVMDKNTVNKGAVARSKKKVRPDAPIYIPPAVRKAQQTGDKSPNLNEKKCIVSSRECNVKEESSNNKTDSGNKIVNVQKKLNSDKYATNDCKNEGSHKSSSDKYMCNLIVNYTKTELKIRKWRSLPIIMSGSFKNYANSVVPDLSVIKSTPNIYIRSEDSETISNITVPVASKENTTMLRTSNINLDSVCSISTSTNLLNEESTTLDNDSAMKNKVIISDKQLSWIDKNDDSDERELVRASEEINRRNKRIMKQSFSKSDILIISEANLEQRNDVNCKSSDIDIVDCWEDLVDENGQLDQDIMLKITEHLGNVSVHKAKEDYRDFKNKNFSDDFLHVLEIYDFPKEFQTRDLVSIFENYKSGTYHIKWVDDNHALGIFSSPFAANEVLKMKHPLIKLRPFSEASRQSISKAKRYPNAMMPFAVRPQTCPQTARRIVSGALGLKLNNAKEERAKEIKILKEAREKKKLAAKQQDEAWEGKRSS